MPHPIRFSSFIPHPSSIQSYPLFQITDNTTGEVFIIHGSNWDEFAQIGNWQPGRIVALAEQIQEVLGYNKEFTLLPADEGVF